MHNNFKSFHADERTPKGIEAIDMMRKELVKRFGRRDAVEKAKFIERLFEAAVWQMR